MNHYYVQQTLKSAALNKVMQFNNTEIKVQIISALKHVSFYSFTCLSLSLK